MQNEGVTATVMQNKEEALDLRDAT